jgi:hypothetical protein
MGRFTPWAPKRETSNGPRRTIAERNVRPILGVFPQESPDPPRDGAIPCRPARWPIVTFSYDTQVSSDWRFQTVNPEYYAGASVVPGRNQPWDARVNIAVPQHVAYGSLFTQDTGGY